MSVIDERLMAEVHGVPRPSPESPRPRREFWVVEGGFDVAARVARLLGSLLLATFIVGLVGALVLQATIIERQRGLDSQRAEVSRLQTETESMRHDLAELQAPARIVAAAKNLGMIEAPSIVYLNVLSDPLDDRTLIVAENQLRTDG